MIKRMIKQVRQLDKPSRLQHKIWNLVLYPQSDGDAEISRKHRSLEFD
jgi:hypothetical protein